VGFQLTVAVKLAKTEVDIYHGRVFIPFRNTSLSREEKFGSHDPLLILVRILAILQR